MKHTIDRRRMLLTAVTAAAALAPLSTGAKAPSRYGILGRTAPALAVPWWIDASGEPTEVSNGSLREKWVFLKCFQSWCPGCHSHGFPTLKQVSDAFASEPRFVALGVQTVFEGFQVNSRDKVREIQLRYKLDIPMGHDAGDPEGDHRPRTMRDYRTGGTPWIVVIAPSGQVVFNDYHMDAPRFIARMRELLEA